MLPETAQLTTDQKTLQQQAHCATPLHELPQPNGVLLLHIAPAPPAGDQQDLRNEPVLKLCSKRLQHCGHYLSQAHTRGRDSMPAHAVLGGIPTQRQYR
jgi:hypothetical protein